MFSFNIILFFSDKIYMEIISYVGQSSAVKKSFPSRNLNFAEFRTKNSSKFKRINSLDIAEVSAKSSGRKIRSVSIGEKKSIYEIFAFLAILILVPFCIFRVLPYIDGALFPLRFSGNAVTEFEFLNGAMAKFAIESAMTDVDENGDLLFSEGTAPASSAVVQTVTFQNYKVQTGDSISTISRKFGLKNISTLIAVNNIDNVRSLRSGQTLKIPSQDGLVHKVQPGDSLNALSVKFHISVEEILDANDLSSEILTKGMELFIPGAKMDASSLKKAMGELFVSPITTAWRLSSKFGSRKDPISGVPSSHKGIDMACAQGTPIRAAMSGKVVFVGWSNIFGNYVIIDHGNGYQSLYGHMLKSLATKGQAVDQNTRIGLVGSTGYSTGPHLHFQVFKNGNLVDPLSLIKR